MLLRLELLYLLRIVLQILIKRSLRTKCYWNSCNPHSNVLVNWMHLNCIKCICLFSFNGIIMYLMSRWQNIMCQKNDFHENRAHITWTNVVLFWQRQAMSSSKIPLVYSKCISNEHHLIHISIQIKYDKFTIRLIDLLSY